VVLLLAIGLTGVLTYVTQAAQDSAYAHNLSVATILAQDLMEEVRSKCWDETSTTSVACSGTVVASVIGADGAENRANYDDIDDFNNLALIGNTPPQDSQGVSMTVFPFFTQRATVCYVNSAGLNTCVAGPTDYKRVSVNIAWSTNDQAQLVSVFSNHVF